jgi:DNA replication and repair protein RecF
MFVQQLSVADFRNWPQAELRFDPGPSVLVGPNGEGKTNLLEALGYLASLGSHRVATDAPLVRAGAERATVRAAVVSAGRQLLLEVEISPGRTNRARLNRSPVGRPRDILGGLRIVLFAPEDLAVVRGDPAERRRFLDELLVQRTPRLAGVRGDYDRVLRQRSALLKTAGAARRGGGAADLRTLDVWDQQLAGLGAQLLAARLDLVAALRPYALEAYTQLAPGAGRLGLRYVSVVEAATEGLGGADRPVTGSARDRPTVSALEAAMLAELARLRPQEIERGVTLAGPHRDDLELTLGPLALRGYASHGEGWSAALALRLACFELLSADGVEPVLILDDVFAELDAARRGQLAAVAAKAEQVLISAAVLDDVPVQLAGVRYEVNGGEVIRRAG